MLFGRRRRQARLGRIKVSGRGVLRRADGLTSGCEYELEREGQRFRLRVPPVMVTQMHALVAATLIVEEGDEFAGNLVVDLVGLARLYVNGVA